MQITIRRARLNDLEQIINLACETVIHSVSPARTNVSFATVKKNRRLDLDFLNDNFYTTPGLAIFVAETERKEIIAHVILIAGVTEQYSLERQTFIFDISVKEIYRRKGIASLLYQKSESFSKKKDCRYLALGVTSSNEKAVLLNKKIGFTEERLQLVKSINEKQKEDTIKNALLNLPDITFKQLVSVSPEQLGEITELYLEEILPAGIFPLREVNPDRLKQQHTSILHKKITNSLGFQDCQMLIAEDKDGRIIGLSYYDKNYVSDITGEHGGYLLDLGVKKAYWGTGLAYLLHWKTEKDVWSVTENYHMAGSICASNKRSLNFTKKLSWQEERKYMVKKLW